MTETPEPQEPQEPQAAPTPPAGGQQQTNGLAIAGMVLGIVGLVGICIWWLGLPCAIVGLVLSIMGKKKAKVIGKGEGMATAGIVTSIIALGLGVVGIILAAVGLAILGHKAGEIQKELQRRAPQSMLLLKSFLA